MVGPPVGRRDPLPGLTDLPRWLRRNVPRPVRIGLLVAGALGCVGLAFLIPALERAQHRREAASEREDAALRATRTRDIRRAQRPHEVVLPARGRPRTLRAGLERAVLADARGRHRSGELPDPVFRASCAPYTTGTAPERPGVLILECLGLSRSGRTGYPFRARLVVPTGRATWCRNILPPAHPDQPDQVSIALSGRCTGEVFR